MADLQYSERGEVWVFNACIVEWRLGGKCVRKFEYHSQKVLKAGFVDFETVKGCLTIVLEDRAHIYYVTKGDSSTVSFPFLVSKAFFHANGVVLERNLDDCAEFGSRPGSLAAKHRFITLSDPLNLFGSLVISANNQEQLEAKATILHFPDTWDNHISVLYDPASRSLYFYSSKILTSPKAAHSASSGSSAKKSYAALIGDTAPYNRTFPSTKRVLSTDLGSLGSSSSSGPQASNYKTANTANSLSTELTNNLRKISIMNRRSASATIGTEPEQPIQTAAPAGSHPGVDFMKRSASATLDRMGSGTALDITPSNSSQISRELFDHAVLTKDVVLTKISQTPLPLSLSPNTRVFSCNFEDKEAVILHDRDSQWGKIWIFELNSVMTENTKYKAFNSTPIALTKIIDIKWPVICSACVYHSTLMSGYLMLLSSSQAEVTLYNPFLNLTSSPIPFEVKNFDDTLHFAADNIVVFSEKNPPSHLTILPQVESVSHCFLAMKYLCDPFTYHYIMLLWQVARLSVSNTTLSDPDFTALEYTLLSLLDLESSPDPAKQHIESIRQSPIFNSSFDGARYLPKIVMGIHLIREDYKLNLLQNHNIKLLGHLLYLLTALMRWPTFWSDFYSDEQENKDLPLFKIRNCEFAHPLDEPPSILKSLYSVTDGSAIPVTPFITFSRLVDDGTAVDHIVTPRTHKILQLFESFDTSNFSRKNLLEIMNSLTIDSEELETFPLGIYAPLKRALKSIENQVSNVGSELSFSLIDRSDLQKNERILKSLQSETCQISRTELSFENQKSGAGGLLKKPPNIKKIIDQIYNLPNKNSDDSLSVTHGGEEVGEGRALKRNASLIFSEDRRFFDVIELLLYNIPHKITIHLIEKSYTKMLKKKRLYSQILALRTFTSGIGWGAVAFSTERPLATQKWPHPRLNLNCVFPDKTTVNVDPKDCDQNLLSWGEFHGGVSSGLRISRKSTGITGSWITFTRPSELDAQHGGFLLGLGLNGHLKNLEEWHVYNYLSPKQTHTSISLMLGMCASLRGTMDLKLTKVLSVHIVALLPQGSSDLNVNFRVQTAGIIGVGLLYQSSQHRRMSDMLFSQITSSVTINDELVPDEGYRLAAGIALGLINIGAGAKMGAFQHDDPSYSDGDDEIKGESGFRTNNGLLDSKITTGLMSIATSAHDVEEEWMPANSQMGAVVALMLIYCKTNNTTVAEKLAPNVEELNMKARPHMRPELFMYREWAYHLILWDHIGGSTQWLFKGLDLSVPLKVNTDFLPVYYCIAGRALALGLKFASTGNKEVRNNLLVLADKLLPLYQCSTDMRLDFQLTIKTINVLINVLLVSASMIMSGTGDLVVLRRVKYLHETITGKHSDLFRNTNAKMNPRKSQMGGDMSINLSEEHEENSIAEDAEEEDEEEDDEEESNFTALEDAEAGASEDYKRHLKDEENHYGKYMATSLCLGFLLLGSGQYAFRTSRIENLAYLAISVIPTYTTPFYLQETRHFWSMAVEYRSLLIRNSKTGASLNKVPVEIIFKGSRHPGDSKTLKMLSPCLLPDIRRIRAIRISSPEYYPVYVEFKTDEDRTNFFNNGCVLYLPPKESNEDDWEQEDDNIDRSSEVLQTLKKKVQSLSPQNTAATASINATKIFEHIGLNKQEPIEFESEVMKLGKHEDPMLDENLLMSCQNRGKKYQLELWRRRHGF